jgi:hypothetical protein
MQKAKQLFDKNHENLYDKLGNLKTGADPSYAKGLNEIRRELKENIENFASEKGVKNIKQLNSDIATGKIMQE